MEACTREGPAGHRPGPEGGCRVERTLGARTHVPPTPAPCWASGARFAVHGSSPSSQLGTGYTLPLPTLVPYPGYTLPLPTGAVHTAGSGTGALGHVHMAVSGGP